MPAADKPTKKRLVIWLLVFFAVATVLALLGTNERTRTLVGNTLLLSCGTIALSVPAGTVLAWLVSRTNVPGHRAVGLLLVILLFVPLYLQTAAWDAGFGTQGWFQVAAGKLNAPALLSGWRGAIWVHTIAAIPWVALIVAVGLRAIVPEWEDAAALDARPWRVFLTVGLPPTAGSMVIAAVWVLVMTAGEITVTDVFQIRTFAEELYIGYARGVPEAQGPAFQPLQTTALTHVGLTAWLTLGALAVCVWIWPGDRTTSARSLRRFDLGPWKWVAALGLLLAAAILVAVPLGNLLYKLGITVEQIGDDRVRGWSLTKAAKLMGNAPRSYRQELGWSLLISQATAVAAVAIGIVLAWLAAQGRRRAAGIAVLIAIGFAIPGPTLAIGLIGCFNQPGVPLLTTLYDRSIAAPWLGLTLRSLPIVTLILWEAFRTIPPAELESARLAGAGIWRRLFRIALPQRSAALVCAWFVAVAVAAGELTTSILLVPPGVTTLSIRIFGLVHYGVEDRLAALCLWSIAVFVGFALLAIATLRAWQLKTRDR